MPEISRRAPGGGARGGGVLRPADGPGGGGNVPGAVQLRRRHPRRDAPSGLVPTGVERLELPADGRSPVPGRARARHLREHDRLVAGALAAARQQRVLRLRPRLRRVAGQPGPGNRRHPHVRRPARCVRRPRAPSDGRDEGRRGRPLAGRHDAALVHQVPRRRPDRARARRLGPLEPRHDPRRARVVGARLSGGTVRVRGAVPGLRATVRGLELPRRAQRRRRHRARSELHGHRDQVRHSCDALHVGVPLGAERHEHHAPGPVRSRPRRTRGDHLRRDRAARRAQRS